MNEECDQLEGKGSALCSVGRGMKPRFRTGGRQSLWIQNRELRAHLRLEIWGGGLQRREVDLGVQKFFSGLKSRKKPILLFFLQLVKNKFEISFLVSVFN